MNGERNDASNVRAEGGSFRDPSGFVYRDAAGVLLRQVNQTYAKHFERLNSSGLFDALMSDGLMIHHRDVPIEQRATGDAVAVLAPDPVPFFSYPYEWCFGQLRDAALLTLDIQERALASGMILKDASAFNVTFHGNRPVFIDALSFEVYEPGRPWVAYAQFCRHFLAPLALMAYIDVRVGSLLRTHIDGVPLDLASSMLPMRSRLNLGIALHIRMHARTESRHSVSGAQTTQTKSVSQKGIQGIVAHLRGTIQQLRPARSSSHWVSYIEEKPYTDRADEEKAKLVRDMLSRIQPGTVWDLGANTGEYAEMAAEAGANVVALEQDAVCVEAMYGQWKDAGNLTPVWMDLSNPSPALGWAHEERDSLVARGPADCVLALALLHHLRIGNNVPFERVADLLATIGQHCVVEFVPKDDPKPQFLLRAREDIFDDYTEDAFEAAFTHRFRIRERRPIEGSARVLYWFERAAP